MAIRVKASPKISDDSGGEQLVQRLDIRGHPGHQPADRVPVEVLDAESLKVSEDLHTQVVHDALTDERREQGAEVLDHELQKHRAEIEGRQQPQKAHVSMRNRDVERMFGQTRTDEGKRGLAKQQKQEREPSITGTAGCIAAGDGAVPRRSQ